MKNKQVQTLCLEVLSPVHIGCDEVYEPTGFSLDESEKCLRTFDPMDFVSGLKGKDLARFAALCQKGTLESIRDIYRFMQNRKTAGRSVAVCRGFFEHYRKIIKMPENRLRNELNRFEISRTSYRPIDQRPYIPGSSIKGALRTALLNNIAQQKPMKTPGGGNFAGRKLEEALLNLAHARPQEKPSLDPFRLLKVSDFTPIGEIATRVVYIVNKKKEPSDGLARGPYQIAEVILPGAVFCGEIIVEKPQKPKAVSMVLDMQNVLDAARIFYRKEKEKEDSTLSQIGVESARNPATNKAAPVRIGRHSGAQCVTINGHRQIRIMQGRGKKPLTKNHTTTVWLTSETQSPGPTDRIQPCGWAAVSAVDNEQMKGLDRIEREYVEILSRTAPLERETLTSLSKKTPEKPAAPKPPPESVKETWENPTLTWLPQKGEVTALGENKKAFATGKDLVPDIYHKKLFGKKKRVTAQKVTVEAYGNAWKIVKIN